MFVLLCVFIALFSFKHRALKKIYPPPSSSNFSLLKFHNNENSSWDPFFICEIEPEDSPLEHRFQKIQECLNYNPQFIIEISIIFKSDSQFVLKQNPATEVLLTDVFRNFPETKFLINVESNLKNVHEALIELIKIENAYSRVLIDSPYDVVIHSARSLEPSWYFGTGLVERTRALIFHSISLLPLITLSGNFLSISINEATSLNEFFLKELHRRNVALILSSVNEKKEIELAKKIRPDGISTRNPKLMEYFH